MKFKINRALLPIFMGSIFFSCEKNELDELNMNSEKASSLTSSNLIFEETFEGSNPFSSAHSFEVGTWDYALQYVSSPIYQGSKVARFEIREDQPLVKDGKRSEVTIVKGADGHIGKNTWYSFAAYFPAQGFEYDNERELINQWYQNGSPATSVRIHKDRIILESGNTPETRQQYDLGAVPKDSWTEFVFHFIHSYGSDGLIEIWLNGSKVKTINGGNMYDDVLPKWKVGIYKSAFKYGTSDVDYRVLYLDNIRVGGENATLADMSSKVSTATTTTTAGTGTTSTTTGTTATTGTTTGTTTGATTTTTTTTSSTQQQVVSYTLINSLTDQDIMTISDGATISMSALGASKFNIRANTNPGTVGVVKFNLTGAATKTRLDDVVPYALFGDERNGDYNNWSAVVGSYTLTATTYAGSKDKVGAATGPAYTIKFNITK